MGTSSPAKNPADILSDVVYVLHFLEEAALARTTVDAGILTHQPDADYGRSLILNHLKSAVAKIATLLEETPLS